MIEVFEFEGIPVGNVIDLEQMVRDRVPSAALYEQLAEECMELAHAAMKVARVIRSENPTPVTFEEADAKVVEELSDVKTVCDVLWLRPDKKVAFGKLQRWVNRLKNRKK